MISDLQELGYTIQTIYTSEETTAIEATKDNKMFYYAFSSKVPNPAEHYHEKFMEYYTGKLKRGKYEGDS